MRKHLYHAARTGVYLTFAIVFAVFGIKDIIQSNWGMAAAMSAFVVWESALVGLEIRSWRKCARES